MLKISENANPNYLAKIVRISNIKKHPNADKLQVVEIDFQSVITGMDCKLGDIYIYFPLECQINHDFLKYTNSFSNSLMNEDTSQKGFFDKHGRVRAVKLRGEPSCGYIIPIGVLNEWLVSKTGWGISSYDINQEFDSFGDILLCNKYVPPIKSYDDRPRNDKFSKIKISRLVDNQFRLHVDTTNLRKNISQINPTDMIGIHYKKHGTSFVVGKVLTKRKLSFIDKVAKFFGASIKETEYDTIYSSRRVIKNEYETKSVNNYYKDDIWKIVKNELEHIIPNGYTLYGEILGFTPWGEAIQKDYDYGCNPNEHKVYIYRITFTNEDGIVSELDDLQIKQFCDKNDLNFKDTLLYYGYAGNLFPNIIRDENWGENFIKELSLQYLEKPCHMCKNNVPAEGIVVRKQRLRQFEAYKLKSFAFLQKETENLDKGIVDMESSQ